MAPCEAAGHGSFQLGPARGELTSQGVITCIKEAKNMTIKSAAALLLVVATLAACASQPEPEPAPIMPEVTYDKMGNPVS
ncbi:hypothetical protein [Aliiroseovarius crassostreae]|uniref:hypothetical protein n=1 Tax=Aliiroseovarius crassostreae TaxID=154981 RepID=UPI0021FFD1FA|nr:hypothetical protein [Aliiroseovarius crassostreae]UWQ06131.1 hypothetical protein K3X22_06840 [Aliiroseovarius crassostreae]